MSMMSWLKNLLSPSNPAPRHRAGDYSSDSHGGFSFGEPHTPSVVTPVQAQPVDTTPEPETVDALPEIQDADLEQFSSEPSPELLRVQSLADQAERYIERNDG